jgi:hypothetical protein
MVIKDIMLHNVGEESSPVTVRLYFSKEVGSLGFGAWTSETSDESEFPSAFYFPGYGYLGRHVINAKDTLPLPTFNTLVDGRLAGPISARLKVYYGAPRPVQAGFIVK